ncbi:g9495 [Coccomyxa viridis]|uniref:G9495 protein n=1 Tax=Coccomyxa viridis TaxID=1274662 RepID=A0ABP1G7A9_9CHLO
MSTKLLPSPSTVYMIDLDAFLEAYKLQRARDDEERRKVKQDTNAQIAAVKELLQSEIARLESQIDDIRQRSAERIAGIKQCHDSGGLLIRTVDHSSLSMPPLRGSFSLLPHNGIPFKLYGSSSRRIFGSMQGPQAKLLR